MNANNKITNKIIEKVRKNNVLPWQKPWKGFSPTNLRNYDPISRDIKDHYKGVNRLLIGFFGDGSEFYLTFNQVKQLGGWVKKGSSGVPIVFYTPVEKKQVNEEEEPEKYFLAKSYVVFSQKSIEGVDFPEILVNREPPKQIVESFINSFVPIKHVESNRAFYSPSQDYINIPKFNRFQGSESYYRTIFHELIHSTGHKDRLNRFEDDGIEGGYSFEELVAEIGACFLSNYFGIDPTPNNSISYLKGWVKSLEDNPTWIVKASSKAERAFQWLLDSYNLNKEKVVYV